MIRDIVNQMSEFVDQEADVDLDTIARWRDELKAKLDSASVEERDEGGGVYHLAKQTEAYVEINDGELHCGDEVGGAQATVAEVEMIGLEYISLAEKARDLISMATS